MGRKLLGGDQRQIGSLQTSTLEHPAGSSTVGRYGNKAWGLGNMTFLSLGPLVSIPNLLYSGSSLQDHAGSQRDQEPLDRTVSPSLLTNEWSYS